jgi:hypothetical protein
MLMRLNQIMRGWSNYFKHAVAKHIMSSLENFVWHRAPLLEETALLGATLGG